MEYVMLTVGGKDIMEIPLDRCESVVKEIQEGVDEKARSIGFRYGEIVSTRRIEQ